jgi:ABC-type phosphate transport system substrate-binding protein
MTSLFARRVVACIASAAALAAVVPATASAKKAAEPKTDRLTQCAGSEILGRGSTFQNPVQLIWEGTAKSGKGFNESTAAEACSGTQGSGGTPHVKYLQGEAEKGSGACLKSFGAEGQLKKPTEVDFCGTDEAPNALQKKEIEEETKTAGKSDLLETIPVLQGAVAVIVDLPSGCTSSSSVTPQRLVLDGSTVEGIYRGTITTWKGVIAAQGAGHGEDKLSCAEPSKENETIHVVVRKDHSGTTHIFKAYLAQVNPASFEAEGKYEECQVKPLEEEPDTWFKVSTGCENQRWPAKAHVVRPTITGNPGVVEKVATTPSSVGYADLAVAREYNFFSGKEEGGENKKQAAKERFWAAVENKKSPLTYMDPSSDGDTYKIGDSNCKKTKYINTETSEEFPPESTRESWSGATADDEDETYPICGLTYDLAFKLYKPFYEGTASEEAGKKKATSVENYLFYEVGKKSGAKASKKTDYEALPKSVLAKSVVGVEEIGYAESVTQKEEEEE